MSDTIAFLLDDGTTVEVSAPAEYGSSPVGLGDRIDTAQRTLREAIAPVTAAAAQVMDGFRKAAQRPDEIEICFGVTLDGKLGGIIASTGAGAHLDVTLRWHGPESAPGTAEG